MALDRPTHSNQSAPHICDRLTLDKIDCGIDDLVPNCRELADPSADGLAVEPS